MKRKRSNKDAPFEKRSAISQAQSESDSDPPTDVDKGQDKENADNIGYCAVPVKEVGVEVQPKSKAQAPIERAATSAVWEHFIKIAPSENKDGVRKGKCKYCEKEYICTGTHGTSNMRRHIPKCPRRVQKDPLQMMVNNSGRLVKKFDQETFKELCAMVVIKHTHPFTWVEHEAVRELMKYLNAEVKPICRNTVKNHCLKIYKREKDRIKESLQKLSGRICLTCDMWTSAVTQGYLCLTAHCVDDDWHLHSLILNFVHVQPPHTARNLYKIVCDLLKEWGIEEKIFSITLDNARTNDSMQEILKNQLNLEKPLLCKGKYFHIRCSAHILNLIVQEGLKLVGGSVRQIREGIKYIVASEARILNFKDCAKRAGCDLRKGLWLDSPTRWNSTHTMLERALLYKAAFVTFELDDEHFKCSLDEEEWTQVLRIFELLTPFVEITALFSRSKYPTANLYFKSVWMIKWYLLEYMKSEDVSLRGMASKMKEKFDKYWDSYSVILAFGIILDPRYKLDFITFSYKKLDKDDEEEKWKAEVDHISKLLFELYNEYVMESGPSTSAASTITDSTCSSNKSLMFSQLEGRNPMKDFQSFNVEKVHTSELRQYLEEGRLTSVQDLDILAYWSDNEKRLPNLSRMARDILTIPITTVASESAFSMGGRVISKLRGSLLPENAEALLITRTWLNAFGKEDAKGEEIGREFHLDLDNISCIASPPPTSELGRAGPSQRQTYTISEGEEDIS